MKNDSLIVIFGRILVLSVILYLLGSFSFTDIEFQTTHFQYIGIYLPIALLVAAVLSLSILRARQGGWRLVMALFLVYYAVSTLLVAIEAYYMSDVISTEIALLLLINGVFQAAILVPVAVAIHGRLSGDSIYEPDEELQERPWWSWLWRVPLTGVAYVAIFILAGSVVFRPLAYALDPVTAEAYLGSFAVDNPNAILGFQFLRGTLWAVLTIPVIAIMRRPRWLIGLTVALIYSVVMALPNLVPNEALTACLRLAHTVEVFVGNFLFGWVVVWLLARPVSETSAELSGETGSGVLEMTPE